MIKTSAREICKYFMWATSLVLLYLQISNTRFLQDDYMVLGYLSNQGWSGWISEVWKGQGGNLWPYALHALLLGSSVNEISTTAIATWTLFVITAVTFSNYCILKWVLGVNLNLIGKFKVLTIFSISYLGFEGLFTPGLIAAYSYHLASFSHLWPITILIFAFYLISKGNKNVGLAVMLGLLIGNSNIAESFAALVTLFLIFFLRNKNIYVVTEFFRDGRRFFYSLLSGLIIGFTAILLSPGFWNRAENSVGLPSLGEEFVRRFIKSFSSFLADLLTHPMVWLAFLIGVLISAPKKTGNEKNVLINKIKLILFFGFILFASLTIGSTFAYVSWHQSTGLYQLFIPLTFILGFYSKSIFSFDFSRVNKVFLLTFIIISLTAITLRAGILLDKRASDWDNAVKVNYCLIKKDTKAKLVGADMLYPGFNLGIEDISKWEWMRNGYVTWVSNPNFKTDIKCISN
jgi:hypothetical protein